MSPELRLQLSLLVLAYSVSVLCHISAFDGESLKHFETMIRSKLRSAKSTWRSRRIEEYEGRENDSCARGAHETMRHTLQIARQLSSQGQN